MTLSNIIMFVILPLVLANFAMLVTLVIRFQAFESRLSVCEYRLDHPEEKAT